MSSVLWRRLAELARVAGQEIGQRDTADRTIERELARRADVGEAERRPPCDIRTDAELMAAVHEGEVIAELEGIGVERRLVLRAAAD